MMKMNVSLHREWLTGTGCVALLGLMLSCSTRSTQPVPSEKAGTMSPAEAKAMVIRFLSSDEATKLGNWVVNSRGLVEKASPSLLPTGNIVVGPWVINPTTKSVMLAIDRAQLDGSVSKIGDRYVITNVGITEIRGAPSQKDPGGADSLPIGVP
jgi:hypothetical protein